MGEKARRVLVQENNHSREKNMPMAALESLMGGERIRKGLQEGSAMTISVRKTGKKRKSGGNYYRGIDSPLK